MKRRRSGHLLSLVSALLVISCVLSSSGGGGGGGSGSGSGSSSSSGGSTPVFTLASTTQLTIGDIWCVPVYDGTNLVISSEASGTVVAAVFDLNLNLLAGPVTVADTSDTAGGDTIADHKHIFQNGFHYISFSTAGAGDGGYLYLLKLDTSLARIGIVEVVTNDPPTNDMFLVGDGTDIFIGKYSPFVAGGHQVFQYDENLAYVNDFLIGMPSHTHANGAAAIFQNSQFELVAPETLGPGFGDYMYGITADGSWTPTAARRTLITDPTFISLTTGLNVEPVTGDFIVHYVRDSTGSGGDIYRALFDKEWTLLENAVVLTGPDLHRPHGVIVNGRLYLGYDSDAGGVLSIYVSVYDISVS